MVVEIRVTGAEQLRALGKDLRAAGLEGKGLRREMLASMRAVGKPLVEKVKESARAELPKAGGLNEFIAKSSITVKNNLTGRKVGTRIVAKKKGGSKGWHDLEAFDNGSFRHPVHGNRKKWVQQSVTPGFFTKPLIEGAPAMQAGLLAAMTATELKIIK
jgi:hypothetical protein